MINIVYRPSVDAHNDYLNGKLLRAFKEMRLIDKTVVEDRIVYVFDEKDTDVGTVGNGNQDE